MRCSFCGKKRSQVRGIVAASTAEIAICDACVALCLQIFEEQGLK